MAVIQVLTKKAVIPRNTAVLITSRTATVPQNFLRYIR